MKKIAAWLLCLVWMAVIFGFSAMPGEVSSEQSGTIVELLLALLSAIGVNTAALDLSLLSLLVRKAAHMTEYAVLFFLLHWPCSTTLWTIRRETGSTKWTLLAALLPTAMGMALCAAFTALARALDW